MTPPTRRELDELALDLCCSYLAHADDQRPWLEAEHERVVELLRSYPLSEAEEQREQLAAWLEMLFADRRDPQNYSRHPFSADVRAMGRRAAALLRAPAAREVPAAPVEADVAFERWYTAAHPEWREAGGTIGDEVTQQCREAFVAGMQERAPTGVDREAVLRLVNASRHATLLPGCTLHTADRAFADLLEAIRALPEAEP